MQKQFFSFIVVLVIVAAIPVTLYLSQNKTSLQQKASEYDLGDEDALMENFKQSNKGEREQQAHTSYRTCRKQQHLRHASSLFLHKMHYSSEIILILKNITPPNHLLCLRLVYLRQHPLYQLIQQQQEE